MLLTAHCRRATPHLTDGICTTHPKSNKNLQHPSGPRRRQQQTTVREKKGGVVLGWWLSLLVAVARVNLLSPIASHRSVSYATLRYTLGHACPSTPASRSRSREDAPAMHQRASLARLPRSLMDPSLRPFRPSRRSPSTSFVPIGDRSRNSQCNLQHLSIPWRRNTKHWSRFRPPPVETKVLRAKDGLGRPLHSSTLEVGRRVSSSECWDRRSSCTRHAQRRKSDDRVTIGLGDLC